MAKTPKVKKREISIHSRAARRGASPPSKDLAVKTTPTEEIDYKPWIHSTQNGGISKKKKSKQLTRQQKLRQQRGLENAERNVGKHEKKLADSKTRGKKVQARRAEWEALNDKISGGENQGGVEKKKGEVEGNYGAGGNKKMEGVEVPDLEQPLPIRTAEEVGEGVDEGEVTAVPG